MFGGSPRLRGLARDPQITRHATTTTFSADLEADAGPNGARKRESHHISFARPFGAIALATLFAVAGVITPAAASRASAATSTKVVIVVGPVGDSTTASYITEANAAAAVARKYTSNVITIYSPHATWSAVKSAMAGANILLYLGHGNGFPSPYSSTLNTTGMDGFGLNATDNKGNYNWAYYGETYVSSVKMAANSVVLFNRLCYASGNSEWGKGNPTYSVATQRVDNYAAAFIKSGAKAVIADGLGDISWYMGQLFTRHSSIENLYRGAPNAIGNYASHASSRSSGFTSLLDIGTYSWVPDGDKYYRSMVYVPSLTTDAVVGSAGSTSVPSASGLSGRVGSSAINLRYKPSTSASIVRSLPAGTAFAVKSAITLDSAGRTWAYIQTATNAGYIATANASFSGAATTTASVNLRSAASTSGPVKLTLGAGTRFRVARGVAGSDGKTWFVAVLSNGTSGYVASWYTKP